MYCTHILYHFTCVLLEIVASTAAAMFQLHLDTG